MPNNRKNRLTVHQKAALIDYQKPVLIAASAGSGKTMIMVERIIEYLSPSINSNAKPGDLDRIIVLTFTRKAAEELKSRLIKKLTELIQSKSSNSADLRAQIEKMNTAMIGTIDSFCNTIYSQHFDKIGLDANFSLIDDFEENAYLSQIINQKIEDYSFDLKSPYSNLFDILSSNRNFRALEDYVKTVIEKMSLYPDIDNFPVKITEDELEKMVLPLLDNPSFIEFTKPLLTEQEAENVGFKKGVKIDAILKDAQECQRIREAIEDLKISFASRFGKKQEEIDFLRELIAFSKECREDLLQEKKNRGLASYADIERYAYEILSTGNPSLAHEMSHDIDMIFIDEYQDTNAMQEEIISQFNVKNLFYVGDIKQSIYRFRYAEPSIFSKRLYRYLDKVDPAKVLQVKKAEDYKNLYKNNEGVVIYFDSNFRSSTQITDFVNSIFAANMTKKFGKVDYKSTSMMVGIAGKKYGDFPAIIINGAKEPKRKETIDEKIEPYSVKEACDSMNSNGRTVSLQGRKEAHFQIIDYIKYAMSKQIDCGGSLRNVEYGDFAILVRAGKQAKQIIQALREEQIPYDANITIKEQNKDIDLFIAFLKVLDNPYQDIPLIQVLLSYFGDFTDEELLEIRNASTSKQSYFYESFFHYPKSGSLSSKIDGFNNMLQYYRDKSKLINVADLMMGLATDKGYDAMMMYESSYRIEVFNSFISYLRDKDIAKNIKTFLFAAQEGNLSSIIEEATNVNLKENCVKITTIHKSKGLEYPIVIIPPQSAASRYQTSPHGLEYHIETGFGVEVRDAKSRTKMKSFRFNAIQSINKVEEYEEEMRINYVALTRAQNHLFILYDQNKENSNIRGHFIQQNKCFVLEHLLNNALSIKVWGDPDLESAINIDEEPKGTPERKLTKEEQEEKERQKIQENKKNVEDKFKIKLDMDFNIASYANTESIQTVKDFYKPCEIKETLKEGEEDINYQYPYENTKNYQAKYTVTELTRPDIKRASRKIEISIDDQKGTRKKSSIQEGIAYHKVLELIDINKADLKEVEDQIAKFEDQGIIEKNSVDYKLVHKIIADEIFNLARNGNIAREQKFYYRDNASSIIEIASISSGDKNVPDDEITVQGVIDVVITCGKEVIIVDYKYSQEGVDKLIKQYSNQVNLYRAAVESVLGIDVTQAYIINIRTGEKIQIL